MKDKKTLIIGLGYIGLPLYLMLLSKNYKVTGFDTDKKKINLLKKKNFLFEESSLNKLYKKLSKNKKINITNKFIKSDIYIICVPTPLKKNNKFEDKYLKECFKNIIPVLKKGDLIIIESTCKPNTTNNFYLRIKKDRKDLFENESSISLAYCPETIIPGNTLYEMQNNYKLIGGINEKSSLEVSKIYKSFNKKIILTSALLAELSKLSQNAFRDVNIALANEIFNISNKYNVYSSELIKLSNLHPRVNILQPSIGVGGHCIPVDPWFIIENYNQTNLIKTSRDINNNRPKLFSKKIIEYINKFKKINNFHKIKIGFLGMTYKPDTSDFRGSPSLEIISKIINQKKINIISKINDPLINKKIIINNQFFFNENINQIINWSDLIIILVNHSIYKKNDKLKKIKNKIILPNDL